MFSAFHNRSAPYFHAMTTVILAALACILVSLLRSLLHSLQRCRFRAFQFLRLPKQNMGGYIRSTEVPPKIMKLGKPFRGKGKQSTRGCDGQFLG